MAGQAAVAAGASSGPGGTARRDERRAGERADRVAAGGRARAPDRGGRPARPAAVRAGPAAGASLPERPRRRRQGPGRGRAGPVGGAARAGRCQLRLRLAVPGPAARALPAAALGPGHQRRHRRPVQRPRSRPWRRSVHHRRRRARRAAGRVRPTGALYVVKDCPAAGPQAGTTGSATPRLARRASRHRGRARRDRPPGATTFAPSAAGSPASAGPAAAAPTSPASPSPTPTRSTRR